MTDALAPLERLYPNRCYDCLAICAPDKVLCEKCQERQGVNQEWPAGLFNQQSKRDEVRPDKAGASIPARWPCLLAVLVIACASFAFAQPAHAEELRPGSSALASERVVAGVANERQSPGNHAQLLTSSVPDCRPDQKHGTNGIVREGDRAVWVVELDADCVVGLSSFDRQGPRGALVEVAVASGRGTHTLSVRACAQVDAHAGPTFERDAGDKFTSETYEETQCQSNPTTSTTAPVPQPRPTSTSTTSVIPSPTSAPSADTPAAGTTESCVPDCENPDAPEHVPPELARGGAPEGAVPMALFGLAAILLGGAPLVWHGEKVR